jgi:hypothetical protein
VNKWTQIVNENEIALNELGLLGDDSHVQYGSTNLGRSKKILQFFRTQTDSQQFFICYITNYMMI